jgi:glutathionylspermidine synthase
MLRIKTIPRPDYTKKLEDLSFHFHSLENIYWDESVYYSFTLNEVLRLEKATDDLWGMMLHAVQHVIDKGLYKQLRINPDLIPLIIHSWNEEEPSIYGRFDLAFDGTNIKMLEFNADTPTSLYEASVVQWYWMQDTHKDKDQFNSIHDKILNYWTECKDYFNGEIVHFACVKDSIEDFTTVEYLRDLAHQGGLNTKFIYVEDIGWDDDNGIFIDKENVPIANIFKLYPWEWLIHETYGPCISEDENQAKWIEPAWKTILSNKAILPILYELFPNSPYILPAYYDDPHDLKDYVKKPIFSREGANVTIFKDGKLFADSSGEYGEEGFVYQGLANIPHFDGNYPVIGSWVIDQQSCGIGIRESKGPITDNYSRFIPHIID